MDVPSSLRREISPPRPMKRRKTSNSLGCSNVPAATPATEHEPTLAAVEAGRAKLDDHLAYFRHHLAKASRQTASDVARLAIEDFAALYEKNLHQNGNHFVIHQHNHPKAGVHYDLRLQFSETSSMSFAVPKGLPGNPNSMSIGRMAIETRVHNYWNHLIESASSRTGSLLIWDTGTYKVLPRKYDKKARKRMPSPQTTDDENSISDLDNEQFPSKYDGEINYENENEKLISAFKTRYIRLRLHGTRLPRNYTIILRLPSNEIIKPPTARRKSKGSIRNKEHLNSLNTDSESEQDVSIEKEEQEEDLDTDTDEDTETRLHNAYPGSTNSIGSIHQRHWFLMLDRHNSGFVLDHSVGSKGQWIRNNNGGGFEPFIIKGRDHERSVVTGRLAKEVESDEGIEGYVGRGGWVGIEH